MAKNTCKNHSPPKTDRMSPVVFAWGNMTQGQLGLGGIEEEQILSERLLSAMSGKQVKDIAAGVDHTVFLMQDGIVYSCGSNDHGQLGHDKARRRPEVVDVLETQVINLVACGMAHSVAVNKFGHLYTWGDNQDAQLGRITTGSFSKMPKMVKELNPYCVIQVACGYQHTLALIDSGELFSWGRNKEGQLGINDSNVQAEGLGSSSPCQVTRLRGLAISQIAAGSRHSMALTVSGALFVWGHNRYGQLGVGDEKDYRLPYLCEKLRSLRVKYVSCGEDHTAVLTQDGGVFTFGAGMYGQLGHNTAQSEKVPRKVFELMGSVVTMIACGRQHTMAYVQSSNKLYTFGLGGNGQLGLGAKVNCLSPTPRLISDGLVVSIYAGGDQCLLLAAQPSTQQQSRPTAVSVSRDFRQRLPESQILKLTKDTIIMYRRHCDVQKPSIEFQSQIEKVFMSPSCLNASFLTQDDQHFFCSATNHGVSLTEAEEVFDMIRALKNNYVRQIILGAIEKTLIPVITASSPVDIEALRLFLTLPFLDYFSDPECYGTIICPFALAIINLFDCRFNKVIESWWLQLGSAYLLRLILMFKRVLLFILDESPTQVEAVCRQRRVGLFCCLEVLQKLHTLTVAELTIQRQRFDPMGSTLNGLRASDNCQVGHSGVPLVPYESFYIPELKDKVDLRADYILWLQSMGARIPFDAKVDVTKLPASPDGRTLLYCNYPFIFDGQAKTLVLQVDGMLQMQRAVDEITRRNIASLFLPIDPVNPCFILIVHRDNLVQDTLNQLMKQQAVDFKKPLKVVFYGEEALDAGGVRKEFFLLLLKEVLDPKYGMFQYFPESKLLWFNQEPFETNEMYELIGLLCGLAIYNCIIIDISLPLALYRKLLKKKVTLDDLKQLQPAVGRSMEQLLEYAGDDFQDVFGLSFEITREVYGQVKVIELVPRGSTINVTQDNKQSFVDAYVDYIFNSSVNEQFEAFSKGFHKVCGGPVLDLFQPQELQAMVVGNENYDWVELEKNSEYKGAFTADHPTIRMFWNVFHRDLSLEDKKKFLLFLTGSDRIPILGMKAVKLQFQPVAVNDDYLPVAHTCFNLLDLPMYSSREAMRRKILLAIEHTHGFGLA